MNKDYLLKLEEKVKTQEEIITNFQKEQTASVEVFKKQNKTIENLERSNTNLIAGNDRLTKANDQLKKEKKADQKTIKDLQKESKSLTNQLEASVDETELLKEKNEELVTYKQSNRKLQEQNKGLVEKYANLENTCQNQAETLRNAQQELTSQQEKNNLLEERIRELENEEAECLNCQAWESEKETILVQAEQTRNEQGKEIEEWETKYNSLLNQKQQLENELLFAPSAEQVSQLEQENKLLKEKVSQLEKQNPNLTETKFFTCSHCQQEWTSEFLKLIDSKGNKTCADCLTNMLELTKQETGKEIVFEEQSEIKPEPIKPCQFCGKNYEAGQLKPRHILNIPNHDPRETVLICQSCLTYRAKKADYYCPLTSEGKDTYEGNEFDCFCPTNPQSERRTL